MDRYVIREPRVGTNYPQGNQMIAFTTNIGNSSTMIPTDNVYYEGSYPNEYSNNMTPMRRVPSGYMAVPQSPFPQNQMPQQGQVMSGIDPRYLAGYSENAQYISTGQQVQREVQNINTRFGNDYQNRSFAGPEKSTITRTFTPQTCGDYKAPEQTTGPKNVIAYDNKIKKQIYNHQPSNQTDQVQRQAIVLASTKKELCGTKKDSSNLVLSRSDKLKALHKGGPRAFSGPVEKVLKWHKALQDIGVFVFYEIVAKCVSVRAGEACTKNLVVRDDNGPAMQVVYYEIDFLLPELKPPCVVRVLGRMMPGTCRLQAFSVRPATGDDVATLSRRAAVAAHHVARLCKEYGVHV